MRAWISWQYQRPSFGLPSPCPVPCVQVSSLAWLWLRRAHWVLSPLSMASAVSYSGYGLPSSYLWGTWFFRGYRWRHSFQKVPASSLWSSSVVHCGYSLPRTLEALDLPTSRVVLWWIMSATSLWSWTACSQIIVFVCHGLLQMSCNWVWSSRRMWGVCEREDMDYSLVLVVDNPTKIAALFIPKPIQ